MNRRTMSVIAALLTAASTASVAQTAKAPAAKAPATTKAPAQATPVPLARFRPPAGPICRGSEGYAADWGGRRTFLWRPADLDRARAKLTDPAVAPAYAAVLKDANAALKRGPYTVVDKIRLPASGDKHDYVSLGPYWWPDPKNRNGPYLRRDGETNPERSTDAYDLTDLARMSADVEALSLAYHFTGEKRYAAHAALLLRTWFLDPATRMNPNINHGQSVPGRAAGRAEGIIDAHRLVRVVESIGLLGPSGALAPADQEGLQTWFGDLVEWMATSPIGREERAAKNNHGVFYDLLVTQFALFAGMDDVATAVVSRTPPVRIAAQMAPDGSLPGELTRSRSFHYSAWTLTAWADLAALGECVGVDLWRFQTPDGRGIRRGVDFLAAYSGRERDWPHKELNPNATGLFHQLMLLAGRAYADPALLAKAAPYAERNREARINLGAVSFDTD